MFEGFRKTTHAKTCHKRGTTKQLPQSVDLSLNVVGSECPAVKRKRDLTSEQRANPP